MFFKKDKVFLLYPFFMNEILDMRHEILDMSAENGFSHLKSHISILKNKI